MRLDQRNLVEQYSQDYPWVTELQLHFYEEILKFAGLSSHQTKNSKLIILDAGCGLGLGLFYFSQFNFTVYGIDVSKYALVRAQEKHAGLLCLSDLENGFPFKTNSFQLVLMKEVLEHLYNPYKALKEAFRVLKDDGILIITTPNQWDIKRLKCKLYGEVWSELKSEKFHTKIYNPFEIIQMLYKVGFSDVKRTGLGITYIPYLGRSRLGVNIERKLSALPIISFFSYLSMVRAIKR